MKLTAQEKQEVIKMVEGSELGVHQTLLRLGIAKSTFYKWYKAYLDKGMLGLEPKPPGNRRQWNTIPEVEKTLVVELALEYSDLSPRELACKLSDTRGVFISESSVYRILKSRGLITTPNHILLSASDSFEKKTMFVHEMWQTDFTYFKIIGWGWYYLSTIIDDYSRYIVHWELCSTMKAENVQSTIAQALIKSELKTSQRPILLSDNGACYVSSELKDYLSTVNIKSIHGRVMHPQTQGKIERYHRSMKNIVKLENYYHPEQLVDAIQDFVDYYNHQRYHESLQNVTPSDVYYGRQEQILQKRALIKQQSLKRRKQLFLKEKILHLNNEILYN